MTGRAAGFCAGAEMVGDANGMSGAGFRRGLGRGCGMGRGMNRGGFGRGGFGFRNQFRATGLTGWQRAAGVSPQPEIGTLKDQATYLTEALAGVKKQIEDLESTSAS